MLSLFLVTALSSATLAAVLSQRVVLQKHKKEDRENIHYTKESTHFPFK